MKLVSFSNGRRFHPSRSLESLPHDFNGEYEHCVTGFSMDGTVKVLDVIASGYKSHVEFTQGRTSPVFPSKKSGCTRRSRTRRGFSPSG